MGTQLTGCGGPQGERLTRCGAPCTRNESITNPCGPQFDFTWASRRVLENATVRTTPP